MQVSSLNQIKYSNYKSSTNNRASSKPAVSFSGNFPYKSNFFAPVEKVLSPIKKMGSGIVESIAKAYGNLLATEGAQKIIAKLQKSDFDVVKHIAAFIGLSISATYVIKTLSNEKLDPQKRTTLAINQGIVAISATTLGYTFDKIASKKIDAFANKFIEMNKHETPALKAKYKDGIKAASAMMIFGLMYRYIAPVLVTPLANSIGNKIQAKKEAKESTNV